MGKFLQLGGAFLLLTQLAKTGQQFVQSRLDYEFLGIRNADFTLIPGDSPGKMTGRLKLRVKLTNNNPVAVTITRVVATIGQAGQKLGDIQTNDPITLKVGVPVTVAITLTLAASDITFRIAQILKEGNLLAPLDFRGIVYLSDQTSVPISKQIQFLSIG